MKRISWLAVFVTAILVLAGCAQKEPAEQSAPEPAPQSRSEAEVAPEVKNNGGYYVRVGDRVFFRRYGADAVAKGAVFGEFTAAWNTQGESELMAYTPATGELTALYTESGSGPLWYGDGGFYLSERISGAIRVVWYAADGGAAEPVCDGRVLGVTDSGLLAVERTEEEPSYHTVYAFYRNKAAAGELATDEDMTFAGLTDDGVFLLGAAYSEDVPVKYTLWQITPEGKQIHLGELPETDQNPFVYDVQPDRFLATGGKVVVGVGYYAGTGHFLDAAVFVEADVGREDSLRVLTPDLGGAEGDELPRLTVGEDGSAAFAPALDGELRVSWDEPGALEVRENGAWQPLAEYFAPDLSGGWGYRRIVQHMDYIDGAAYVTLACAHVSPADAIGWREAYALLDMLYLKVERGGVVTELACVDHDAEFYGNVWFVEGESVALWQQLSTADGEGYYDSDYVYAIPIAEDAYWEGGWESVFDGVTGLLPYDYGEGEADYYGYPLPDTEPAGALCLTLDRDGTIASLSRKNPAAVVLIDFDVPAAELEGAAETIHLERRETDEDVPWFWAKLRVLENNVRVRLERTPKELSVLEEIAMTEGAFVAGETLYDGVLDRGDCLALRVSLPWYPEVRVSVSKDGAWGSYVFGEDNYLHLETEDSIHPELTLTAYAPTNLAPYSGEGMMMALSGCWSYRSSATGETKALLYIGKDGDLTLTRDEGMETFLLTGGLDRLYARDWEPEDLLCLRTEDSAAVERIGFDGAVGDYLIELFRIDGEEILHLTQMNNGDGALSFLLPEAGDARYDYVFTRSRGIAEAGARWRDETIPARVVKYDGNVCWLREAEVVDEYPGGGAVWRAKAHAPCLAYPIADQNAAQILRSGRDTAYPMEIYDVSVNAEGAITGLKGAFDYDR